MMLDHDANYRIHRAKDARFDGRSYLAVVTTGIFCRPICPVPAPKRENCRYYPSAAAALEAGFRPCLRCRPELSPDVAAWRGTSNTVSRALALIAEGALDDGGDVEALAARLGVGGRHLRRLFDKHLGAAPVAVAQARRLLFAKRLIDDTTLPMTEIALAAGFGSVRRFNTVMRRTYDRPPSQLRRGRRRGTAGSSRVTLKLPFSPPYNWPALIAFMTRRAIPGIESVSADRYRRGFALGGVQGTVTVRPEAGRDYLIAAIDFPDVAALPAIVARLRRVFDLDANAAAIAAHLAPHPWLARSVAALPGLRVPGAWDGFELAVRAILGQQVTVAGATTLAGRLVAAHGAPLAAGDDDLRVIFPEPAVLADVDLTKIGLTRARAATIRGLAAAVAVDEHFFHPFEPLDEAVARLCRLPGIGEWTAQYIAMRALGEPDAFPASDLGLLRAVKTATPMTPARLLAAADAWRPWRAYAAMYLWLSSTIAPATEDDAAWTSASNA